MQIYKKLHAPFVVNFINLGFILYDVDIKMKWIFIGLKIIMDLYMIINYINNNIIYYLNSGKVTRARDDKHVK